MANYDNDDVMSVGKWMLTLFLLAIPVVNVLCFLVWLLGGGRNKSRSNYIRACFLWSLIITILTAIVCVILYFVFKDAVTELLNQVKSGNYQSILDKITEIAGGKKGGGTEEETIPEVTELLKIGFAR